MGDDNCELYQYVIDQCNGLDPDRVELQLQKLLSQ